MVGLSAQQLLQKRMDTTANNLANLTTSGFKVEHVIEDIESLNQRALGTGSFSVGKGACPP